MNAKLRIEYVRLGISIIRMDDEDIEQSMKKGLYKQKIDFIREAIREKIDRLKNEGKIEKKIRL